MKEIWNERDINICQVFCQNTSVQRTKTFFSKTQWREVQQQIGLWFQVKGKEAQITREYCNEHGIKMLEFSHRQGPFFYYEPPTNETFGDQPTIQDPLDKKYLFLKQSDIFPGVGEGAFATRDVPANTIYSLYSGMLYKENQIIIYNEMQEKLRIDNGWKLDDIEYTSQGMYRYNSN